MAAAAIARLLVMILFLLGANEYVDHYWSIITGDARADGVWQTRQWCRRALVLVAARVK
jgi:hypothetical protein